MLEKQLVLSSLESVPFHLHSYFSFRIIRRRSTNLQSAAQVPAASTSARDCLVCQHLSRPRAQTHPPEGLFSTGWGSPRSQQEGMAASTDKGGVRWSWCCKKRCRDQTGGGLQRWQNCTVIPLCHQSATSAATREPKQQSRCSSCYLSSTAPSPLRVLSCVSTLGWAGAGCQGSI